MLWSLLVVVAFVGGATITITGHPAQAARELDMDIGVITTPYQGAQKTANSFIDADINAILNFSSAQIQVPAHCIIENIDFTIKLDVLTYKLKNEIGL